MSTLVFFLLAFSFVVGLVLFLVKNAKLRQVIVVGACAIIAVASIAAAVAFGNDATVFFGLPNGRALPEFSLLGIEALLTGVVLVLSVKHHRVLAPVFALFQLGVLAWLELAGPRTEEIAPGRLFYFDRLSMVMVLIIGIVGCLICVQALGYMRDYHRHYPLIKGRRNSFFFLLFLFLAAMFGLVCSNYLPLLYVFWEVTTLCSFLLIGYTGTKDTIGYAFTALNMNLLGGCGFAIGLALLGHVPGGLDLAGLTMGHSASVLVLPAVALLALAGISKSAQMPFSSWLLGAMYAPTPTSALLHSSTMVKAGVFLLLKLSPLMAHTMVGKLVTFVGLLTFLFVSLVACTEQNTKKVLAYSTIGNLGLIVGCAGVGVPAALWVGVMIVIFHAVAKSLLFLLVGTLENRLHTKDMENFDNLIVRMPRVSALALIGISGMFIAPFGVVVAKWSAIRAFLDVPGWTGAVFVTLMAFGSGCTIFYWAKLLIKVLSTRQISEGERAIEKRISGYEWFAEVALAVLVLAVTVSLAPISKLVVTPYALGAFGRQLGELFHLDASTVLLLVIAMAWLPVLSWWMTRKGSYDLGDIYSAGRKANPEHLVDNALHALKPVTLRNYYLDGVINGPKVFRVGTVLCGVILSAMVVLEIVKP